jgi:hypothetical protein
MGRPKPTSLKALALIAVVNIVAWAWIYGWKFGWKFGEIDPRSSVGLLVMVGVVASVSLLNASRIGASSRRCVGNAGRGALESTRHALEGVIV